MKFFCILCHRNGSIGGSERGFRPARVLAPAGPPRHRIQEQLHGGRVGAYLPMRSFVMEHYPDGRSGETFMSILLFIMGFIFGIFWFAVIALPLVYGFPKSIWLVFQRQLRWSTPLKYLISPFVWSIAFTLIALAALTWAPNATATVADSAAFNLASLLAIGISILRCAFSAETRTDLRADFDAFTAPYRI